MDGDEELEAYLVRLSEGYWKGKGVVIIPDWDGISEYEIYRADTLALEGYTGSLLLIRPAFWCYQYKFKTTIRILH